MIRWLVAVGLCFGAGFGLTVYKQRIQAPSLETLTFSKTLYPLKNRSFVVAIIARNRGATIDKTILSVLSQNYEPFRVIFIDDGSTDGSDLRAQDVIYSHAEGSRVLYLHNPQQFGILPSLARVADNCSDDELIVVVEEDSLLSHEWVLQTLNQYYAHSDLWITSGQTLHFPTFAHVETPYALKTFYAALFKKVNYQENLSWKNFDFAYMEPMLELAKGHTQQLPEILYLTRAIPSKQERETAYATWKERATPCQPLARLFLEKETAP